MYPINSDDAGSASEHLPLVTSMPEVSHHHLLGVIMGSNDERAALICVHDDANERTLTFELPDSFVKSGDGESVDAFTARTTAYLDRVLKAVFN